MNKIRKLDQIMSLIFVCVTFYFGTTSFLFAHQPPSAPSICIGMFSSCSPAARSTCFSDSSFVPECGAIMNGPGLCSGTNFYQYRHTSFGHLHQYGCIDTGGCSTSEYADGFGACVADTQLDLVRTLGDPEGSCPRGNPIHASTGNNFETEIDYSLSNGGLNFIRYYNSLSQNDVDLGIKWTASYFQNLSVNFFFVTVNQADGGIEKFSCTANTFQNIGPCTSSSDAIIQLEKTNSGYSLTTKNNQIEEYDPTGKLLSITSTTNGIQNLAYNSTTNLLESVTDQFGQSLSFAYDVNNRLETVTDPDNNVYSYSYDSNNNLEIVTYPDNTPLNTNDNPTRTYHYEDTNLPNHLTGITDENSNRYVTWGYDTQGRAMFSEHNGGADRTDFTYNSNGTTTVTDSLGASNTYSYEMSVGIPRTITITGGQCGSGCSGEGQAQTYDVNGFLASRTDFEGNVTTFINNSRGLQTSRTEAVGTLEERTITTEWHPDYRLPTKITEPGKETEFIYDTQGRLLTRTEREI